MANLIILSVLELAAVICCSYGLHNLFSERISTLALIYDGLWFTLGILSNLFGFVAIFYMYYKPMYTGAPVDTAIDSDEHESGQLYLQYHYLFAWLTIVIGYPSYVAGTWMSHYPGPFAHLHLLLAIIPMWAWVERTPHLVVLSTKVATFIAMLSHFFVCFMAGDFWGQLGTMMMLINIFSLILPTRLSLLGFSARELNIIALAVTSYVFYYDLSDNMKHPKMLRKLWNY